MPSPTVDAIEDAKGLFNKHSSDAYRHLRAEEIRILKDHGNFAEDWDSIFFKEDVVDFDRVVRCYFQGLVRIDGHFKGWSKVSKGSTSLPTGLYDSTIADSVIGKEVLIKNTDLVSSCVVKDSAVIVGCGVVACEGKTAFGYGMELLVGPEVGGRTVVCQAEMSMEDATVQATSSHEESKRVTDEEIAAVVARVLSPCSVIGESSRLLRCPAVINCFVGDHAVLENAEVRTATILSNKEEVTEISQGSLVHNCLLQWGVFVRGHAIVKDSVLLEHSHVDCEGKVHSSIICPDASIASGECHCSLVGPFVGFHHQSLLIAALWPKGRGNLAYGSKVGSNHTGRLADQEVFPGEGTFFGLGSSIKLPSNFDDAPYSMVAAGTHCDQQKLEFPFSLITEARIPGSTVQGLNQIRPAWVLRDSPYTVFRNEDKYSSRSRAKRHTTTWSIFRPEIIHLMIRARESLKSTIAKAPPNPYYTSKDIPGLGSNVITHQSAIQAVDTYDRWIKRYALFGLLQHLRSSAEIKDDSSIWQHQQEVLLEEYPRNLSLSFLLQELLSHESVIANAVATCRNRDATRGAEIIPDYAAVHTTTDNDKVVVAVRERLRSMQEEIEKLLEENRGKGKFEGPYEAWLQA